MAPVVPVAPMHKLYAINCKENKRKILENLVRVFTVHNNQAFKCGVISVLLGLGFFFCFHILTSLMRRKLVLKILASIPALSVNALPLDTFLLAETQ